MVLSLPSLGTILRSAGHRETRKLKAKSPFSRIRAFVYLSFKNLFPAELHLSRILPIVSSFRGSMSRAEECRRDRRTFFSNEGRNSTRNGFMRLRVSSLSLFLSLRRAYFATLIRSGILYGGGRVVREVFE